ncbi:MAG TPA: rhomboid family intramembrane serine protease, partial [Thermoanaerobaculia bacterium]|nr:rhomboid family intramembrane serine protease [Thermoanaerobaculia bacterium]
MSDRNDLFAPKLGLTLPLCGFHFIFFFLSKMNPEQAYGLFAFDPRSAFERPWTFVTYQFLHAEPFGLFFGTLILYILGSALEAEWGTAEFTVFWLVSTFGASLAALVTGSALTSGSLMTGASMLFAYAYLFPDMQFLIFFVIPVKVKWLAWLGVAGLGWGLLKAILAGRPGAGFVDVAGAG